MLATLMRFLLLLLGLLVTLARSQASYGSCYDATSTCCFDIDFERLPGYTNSSGKLAQGQGFDRKAFAALGVEIWLDENDVRPDITPKELFPLSYLNATAIAPASTWAQLKPTMGREDLVLMPFESMSPFRPMRNGQTTTIDPYMLHLSFASVSKGKPACVSSLRFLRTYDVSFRMSVAVTAMDSTLEPLGTRLATWAAPTSPTQRTPVVEVDVSIPEVSFLDIQLNGKGYGALASIRACYPLSTFDACSVCGGDGSVCGVPFNSGPKAGQPCTNDSMSNPVCRPGRYDQQLRCVPNLFNITKEVCNGIDDDCDGVIDGGATVAPVMCGVGTCLRTVYQCGSTGETFNTTCVPGQPEPERCDGLDNDCDGLIDEDHVCDEPVTGVPVVPVGVCVSGRLSRPAVNCTARFGYFVRETNFNVTLPYPSERNQVIFSRSAPEFWQPRAFNATSFFLPSDHTLEAFEVDLPACDGPSSSAVWRLGDGVGNFLEAEIDGDAAKPCEEDNYTIGTELVRPIQPIVDNCVSRSLSGVCTVTLGYFNPNSNVPSAYVTVGTPTNFFFFSGGAAGTNTERTPATSLPTPPNVFFPQRVKGAFRAQWSCPTGQERLHWVLVSGGQERSAIAGDICRGPLS